MDSPTERLYAVETKCDALFIALRAILELQSPEMKIAFKVNFLEMIERLIDVGLATHAREEYFEALRKEAEILIQKPREVGLLNPISTLTVSTEVSWMRARRVMMRSIWRA
jgi:hypothetical protein